MFDKDEEEQRSNLTGGAPAGPNVTAKPVGPPASSQQRPIIKAFSQQYQQLGNQDRDFGYNSAPRAFGGASNNPGYLATPFGPRPPPAIQPPAAQQQAAQQQSINQWNAQPDRQPTSLSNRQAPTMATNAARNPVAPPTSPQPRQTTARGIPQDFEGRLGKFDFEQQGGVQVIKPDFSTPNQTNQLDLAKFQLEQSKFTKDVLGQMTQEEMARLELTASAINNMLPEAVDGGSNARGEALGMAAPLVRQGVDSLTAAAMGAQAAKDLEAWAAENADMLAQVGAEKAQLAIAQQRESIMRNMQRLMQQNQSPYQQPGPQSLYQTPDQQDQFGF